MTDAPGMEVGRSFAGRGRLTRHGPEHLPAGQGVGAEMLKKSDDSSPVVQDVVESGAPSALIPAVETVACQLCGVEVSRGTTRCPTCKRFVKANPAAVTSTAVATNLPPDFRVLMADVDRFVAGCLSDEGDPDDVPTRRRALLEYRARLHRRITLLDAALERRGLFDGRGKLRSQWLQRLEGLVNAAKGLDTLLGLQRRQKQVDLSTYLAAKYGSRQNPATTAPADDDEANEATDDAEAVPTNDDAGEAHSGSEGANE